MAVWINSRPATYVGPQSALEIFACRLLTKLLINGTRIYVAFADDFNPSREDSAEFVLAPPPFFMTLSILLKPNLWVGESFILGSWYLKKGNLADFLDLIKREAPPAFHKYYQFTATFKGLRYYLGQYILNSYYTRKVKSHYEVDSKIYELILDEEMIYTCAFFNDEQETLESAQQNKLSAAIHRMDLPGSDAKVLEIGCGWGALARALVRSHANAEICGLSISKGQIDWAKQRDLQSLSDTQMARIQYRVEDYADHKFYNYYDAVAVVGMIEHVGLGGYNHFFRSLYDFLKPGGRCLIHTIVSPTPADPTNRWIDKHIFTGGYAPAISELLKAIEQHPFRIAGIYVYAPHQYRRTIECWLSNLTKNIGRITSHLKSTSLTDTDVEKFIRTWTFYLSGVRNMFSEDRPGGHQVIQVCIKKV
jgi:cyclopropane-fatty-acyl-phospholipid synthase